LTNFLGYSKMTAQVIKLGEGYYFLQIKNLMKQEELAEVWDEIKFLSYRSKFEFDTNTARDNNNEMRSNKIGIWLDSVYTSRKYCNYFKYYQKWITDETKENLLKTNLFWRELLHCRIDTTLFSYYEDGKFYKEHEDTARLTQLFWTYQHPKKFTGGQINFVDFNYQIEIEDNSMVVFPSWFRHEVKPVLLNEKTPDCQDKLLCNGRYVFTTFYS
jgi:hypothetical protein